MLEHGVPYFLFLETSKNYLHFENCMNYEKQQPAGNQTRNRNNYNHLKIQHYIFSKICITCNKYLINNSWNVLDNRKFFVIVVLMFNNCWQHRSCPMKLSDVKIPKSDGMGQHGFNEDKGTNTFLSCLTDIDYA